MRLKFLSAWKNDKKEKENHSDFIVNLSEPKKEKQDTGVIDIGPAAINSGKEAWYGEFGGYIPDPNEVSIGE